MQLTYAQLIKWLCNRNVNPLTNRTIKTGGPVFSLLQAKAHEMLTNANIRNYATNDEIVRLNALGVLPIGVSAKLKVDDSDDDDSYSDDGDLQKYWVHQKKVTDKKNAKEQELKKAQSQKQNNQNNQNNQNKQNEQSKKEKWNEFLRNHYRKYAQDHVFGEAYRILLSMVEYCLTNTTKMKIMERTQHINPNL